MKFESFRPREIKETDEGTSDVGKDMKESADEINRILDEIERRDKESSTSSLESQPRFDEVEARKRVEARLKAMREERAKKESGSESDQDVIKREETREIREHLHSLYGNEPDNEESPTSTSESESR